MHSRFGVVAGGRGVSFGFWPSVPYVRRNGSSFLGDSCHQISSLSYSYDTQAAYALDSSCGLCMAYCGVVSSRVGRVRVDRVLPCHSCLNSRGHWFDDAGDDVPRGPRAYRQTDHCPKNGKGEFFPDARGWILARLWSAFGHRVFCFVDFWVCVFMVGLFFLIRSFLCADLMGPAH
jgi:hypothetical protein